MQATKEQVQAIQRTLFMNPSMKWDGTMGFYSNGIVIIDVTWYNEEEIYKIKFHPNGELVVY